MNENDEDGGKPPLYGTDEDREELLAEEGSEESDEGEELSLEELAENEEKGGNENEGDGKYDDSGV